MSTFPGVISSRKTALKRWLVDAIKSKNSAVKVCDRAGNRTTTTNLLFFYKGCKRVNDTALNALAKFCPGIEVLNLHSCDVSCRKSLDIKTTILLSDFRP